MDYLTVISAAFVRWLPALKADLFCQKRTIVASTDRVVVVQQYTTLKPSTRQL